MIGLYGPFGLELKIIPILSSSNFLISQFPFTFRIKNISKKTKHNCRILLKFIEQYTKDIYSFSNILRIISSF